EPQPIAPAPYSRGDGAPMMRNEASAAAAERSSAQAKQQEDSRLGTGHGRRETSSVQNVAFERATPGPAETITLYYDSYRNLAARDRGARPLLAAGTLHHLALYDRAQSPSGPLAKARPDARRAGRRRNPGREPRSRRPGAGAAGARALRRGLAGAARAAARGFSAARGG